MKVTLAWYGFPHGAAVRDPRSILGGIEKGKEMGGGQRRGKEKGKRKRKRKRKGEGEKRHPNLHSNLQSEVPIYNDDILVYISNLQ